MDARAEGREQLGRRTGGGPSGPVVTDPAVLADLARDEPDRAAGDGGSVVDMAVTYLGIELASPVVASASPVTGDPAMWERLQAAGAGAIVLPSLFEEQVEHEHAALDKLLGDSLNLSGEGTTVFPDVLGFEVGAERHVQLVADARARLDIPVIASINGVTPGGWVHYARDLVDAGASAIELNLYDVVVDPRVSAAEVEARDLEVVRMVRAEIPGVPLAVKVGPWFTAFAHFAAELERAGADGIVMFNRLYQPDIDLATLKVAPKLQLSTSAESRLPLHWIGILRGIVGCSLAATSGVHESADALKLLLAGADVVMTTSSVLRHGPEQIAVLLAGVEQWLSEREYASVRQAQGSVSRHKAAEPEAYERANYYHVLQSWRPGTGANIGQTI